METLFAIRSTIFTVTISVASTVSLLPAQSTPTENPPLIRWQRTLTDALALAQQKNLPLLVVANQDGETACDSLVRNRYRSKEFAQLANRYVAVIGSTDRHNTRDYDDDGKRIACPRFGCVTCGEHIAIEPLLYAKYFKGQRVAPRHIGIGTDGKERFDRFLDVGLHRIDSSLRQHADQGSPTPVLSIKTSKPVALVKSYAHTDRSMLEKQFSDTDSAGRINILASATGSGIRHPGLVRLGLRSKQAKVVTSSEQLLATTASKADLDLLLRTLGTAKTNASYQRVMTGLSRAAETDAVCLRALTIRRALDADDALLSPEWWHEQYRDHKNTRLESDRVPDEDLEDLDSRIEENTRLSRKANANGKRSLLIAQDTLRYALNRIQNSKDPSFLLQDVQRAVTDAEKRGAPISATSPIRARAHWLLNELDQAAQYSQLAIQHAASPQSPLGGAPTAQATAAVLEIYARCQMRIVQSPIPTKDYPALALTRAHQAWQAIALHPFCSETQRKSHIDLLQYVGARRAAGQAIRTGIAKIPTSNLLHDEYRKQVLWESGWPGLANAYQDIPTSGASASAIHWYAGYAALLAAEGHLRHATGNDADPVYVRAIEAFIKSAQSNAAYQQSANHYAALGHGGRAKLALDQRSYAKAVDAILAGAALAPKTFSTPDGLQNTMQRTTRRLRRRISGQKSLLAKLNQGLDEIGIAKQP